MTEQDRRGSKKEINKVSLCSMFPVEGSMARHRHPDVFPRRPPDTRGPTFPTISPFSGAVKTKNQTIWASGMSGEQFPWQHACVQGGARVSSWF